MNKRINIAHTKLVNALISAEMDSAYADDVRRWLRDQRMELQVALSSGDEESIERTVLETRRCTSMWGVFLGDVQPEAHYYVVHEITPNRATILRPASADYGARAAEYPLGHGIKHYKCDHACEIGDRVWHGASAHGRGELL